MDDLTTKLAEALRAFGEHVALSDKHPRAIDRERLFGKWAVEHEGSLLEALRLYDEAKAQTPAAPAPAVGAELVTPGDLRAMFEWVEEAVCYVNEDCKSPSLEREGRALLLKLRDLLRTAAGKAEAKPPVQHKEGA